MKAQTTLYWDLNGTAAGAGTTPTGTWNTTGAANWNTVADGTGTTVNWTAGSHAVFSAGTDATGTFTITLGAAMSVANMTFEEGTATITASTLTLSGAGGSTINVAGGLTATVNSILAGSAVLNKDGDGTFVTGGSGGNTHSGAVNVNAGVFEIAKQGFIGGINNSAAVTVASGATLRLNGNSAYTQETIGSLAGAGTVTNEGAAAVNFITGGDNSSTTFSGVITNTTNALNFQKSGTGTMILSGNNTYTGTTTVNAGALNIQHANALGTTGAGTTVVSGAALEIQGGISVGTEALTLSGTGISGGGALRNISGSNSYAGNITLNAATEIQSDAGTLTTSGGVSGTNQNLTLDGSGNLVFSGAIATGSGTLTKNGTGTSVLSGNNTYTGATTVNAGALNIQHANALGATGAGTTVVSGAALEIQGGITTASEALTLSGTGVSGGGALRNISGNNTYAGTITLSAATEIQSDAGTLTLGATNAVTATNQNLTVDGPGDVVISGTITTGSGTLTKSGAGTLYLTGSSNNTYTGATTINSGGAINIQKAQALGTTGTGTTVNSGGALEIQGGITTTAEALTLNGTGVSGGGALRNVSGNNTYAGAITLASASEIQSDADTLTLTGGINGSAASRALTFDGAGNTTVSSAIGSNISTLTKNGAGLLLLSNANTYTGATTINDGTVRISADNRLGTAPGSATPNHLVFNGGTLETTATFTLSANRGVTINSGGGTFDVDAGTTLTYSGIMAGTGDWNKNDSGILVLGGTTTNTHDGGAVNVNAGTLRINKTGGANRGLGDTSAITVASGATLQFAGGQSETVGSIAGAGTIDNTNATAITLTAGGDNTSTNFSGVIQDTGGNLTLTKTGTGTLTLSGAAANTFAGNLNINDGAVSLAKTAGVNAFAGSTINLGDGAGAADSAVLSLGASNQIVDTAALVMASDGRFDLNGQTETIASIAGSGEILIGTGQLILAGNASTTFSGDITGTTGTLVKQGTGTLTLSATTLNYDGIFELNNGTLRLSNIAANIGTLNVTGNSTIDFAGSSSILNLTNLTISAGVTLTITNWLDATDFFYTQNFTGATLDSRGTGAAAQIDFQGGSPEWTGANTLWQGYDKQITPVPEPSTYGAMIMAGLLGFFGWRRWRHAGKAA